MRRLGAGRYESGDGRLRVWSFAGLDGKARWLVEIDGEWNRADAFDTKRAAVVRGLEIMAKMAQAAE